MHFYLIYIIYDTLQILQHCTLRNHIFFFYPYQVFINNTKCYVRLSFFCFVLMFPYHRATTENSFTIIFINLPGFRKINYFHFFIVQTEKWGNELFNSSKNSRYPCSFKTQDGKNSSFQGKWNFQPI